MRISKQQARKILGETNGKIFTAVFIKKDGTERTMNARTKVLCKLKGGESTIKHKDNLFGCYDVQSGGYRCINLDTLKVIRANGKQYEVGE